MSTFQMGGEVDDQTEEFLGTGLQMGSGNSPTEGYGWAAYHRNYSAAWSGGSATVATLAATRPTDYTFSTVPGPGMSTWTQFFYFGGTPCTPTASCASVGATCGTISDGCGDTLSCGTCSTADECSANKCICKPKACAVGSTWDSSTCSCEVTKVCHTPEQCCVMAGGDWNGHECF